MTPPVELVFSLSVGWLFELVIKLAGIFAVGRAGCSAGRRASIFAASRAGIFAVGRAGICTVGRAGYSAGNRAGNKADSWDFRSLYSTASFIISSLISYPAPYCPYRLIQRHSTRIGSSEEMCPCITEIGQDYSLCLFDICYCCFLHFIIYLVSFYL